MERKVTRKKFFIHIALCFLVMWIVPCLFSETLLFPVDRDVGYDLSMITLPFLVSLIFLICRWEIAGSKNTTPEVLKIKYTIWTVYFSYTIVLLLWISLLIQNTFQIVDLSIGPTLVKFVYATLIALLNITLFPIAEKLFAVRIKKK